MSLIYTAIGAIFFWLAAVWLAIVLILAGICLWSCPRQLRWRMSSHD